MRSPSTAVLVAVHDHSVLPDVLDALAAQSVGVETFRVLVAATEEAILDVPEAIAAARRRHPELTVDGVQGMAPGRAAAHNRCLAATDEELVVFVADDVVPGPEALAEFGSWWERQGGRPAFAIGPVVFPERLREAPFPAWLEDSGHLFGVPFTGPPAGVPSGFFYLGLAAVPRVVFEQVGGFDERFLGDAWDDYEFGLRLGRAGITGTYLPQAVGLHEHPIELEDRRRSMRRGAEAAVELDRDHQGRAPWKELAGVHPLVYRARAAWAGLQVLLGCGSGALARYYEATLAQEFSGAYRALHRARRRGTRSPAGGTT